MDKIWLGKILETGWKKSVVENVSPITDLKSCCTSLTQKCFQESCENTSQSSLQKIFICKLSSKAELASGGSYCLSSLFFTAIAEKKKLGEDNISKKELIVQKLSFEPKATTMKFTREVPREFVDYNYDEILLENIKQACTQYFKEKRNCDILASEQGPSCTRLDQLPNLNLDIHTFYNSSINQK